MRLNGKPIHVWTHTIQNTTNDEVPQLSIFQMTPCWGLRSHEVAPRPKMAQRIEPHNILELAIKKKDDRPKIR